MAERVLQEILRAADDFEGLPAHLYVIAGYANARTSISISVILKLIQDLVLLVNKAPPPTDYMSLVSKALLMGNLANVKTYMQDMKNEISNSQSSISNPAFRGDNPFDCLKEGNARNNKEESFDLVLKKKSTMILRKKESEQEETKYERKSIEVREFEDLPKCEICLDPQKGVDFALDCHIFHEKCLTLEIQQQVIDKRFPVLCPVDGCCVELLPSDIRYCLSPAMGKEYENLSVAFFMKSEKTVVARCPLCTQAFEANKAAHKAQCPSCKELICLQCNCKYHTHLSCNDFQRLQIEVDKCRQCGRAMTASKGSKVSLCACGYMKVKK